METKEINKRYENKVRKVIKELNFIVDEKDEAIIKERLSNGRRYFYIVLPRNENGVIVERFLKIPAQNTKKLLDPFYRQIQIAEFLKQHGVIFTRGVISSRIDKKIGTPYAVMETFPLTHSKIGFIEGFEKAELLNEAHAQNIIHTLVKFHSINPSELPISLQSILKKHNDKYSDIKNIISKFLKKKVRALDSGGEEVFSAVIERRLGVKDMYDKTLNLLKVLKPIIFNEQNYGNVLVHGDMAPNNLYVYDNNDVELLDLEWVGRSENKAMAMIIDYGNLRGRAWNNDIFKNALDDNILKLYKDQGKSELGKAIVSLSILRSNMIFSGYFENYDHDKQRDPVQTRRRDRTEADIKKAWEVMGMTV